MKNAQLITKYVSGSEFSTVFLPLIQKSLECGVPKLQLLALDQIDKMFKSLDYTLFKQNLMPRILNSLETSQHVQVKVKILETIKSL